MSNYNYCYSYIAYLLTIIIITVKSAFEGIFIILLFQDFSFQEIQFVIFNLGVV